METEKLANKILKFQEKWKTQSPWLQEVRQDLKWANTGLSEVWDRTKFRIKGQV